MLCKSAEHAKPWPEVRFSAKDAKRTDYEILMKLQMKAEEYHADYISVGDARDQEFAHNPPQIVQRQCVSGRASSGFAP